MKAIFQKLVDKIRVRNQAEWKALFRIRYEQLRAFVRENGEISALAGFGLGIGIVLFFKVFVFLMVILALAYSVLILIARD